MSFLGPIIREIKGQSHHATSSLFLSPVCLMFSIYAKPLPKREGPYYCFYWSTWRWSNPIIVFLVNKPLWLAHHQHWALPNLEPLKCFPNFEHRVLLLQPFWAKHMGWKSCRAKISGNIFKTWGTLWWGTQWEHIKNNQKPKNLIFADVGTYYLLGWARPKCKIHLLHGPANEWHY
jgi:hypothetical protein